MLARNSPAKKESMHRNPVQTSPRPIGHHKTMCRQTSGCSHCPQWASGARKAVEALPTSPHLKRLPFRAGFSAALTVGLGRALDFLFFDCRQGEYVIKHIQQGISASLVPSSQQAISRWSCGLACAAAMLTTTTCNWASNGVKKQCLCKPRDKNFAQRAHCECNPLRGLP